MTPNRGIPSSDSSFQLIDPRNEQISMSTCGKKKVETGILRSKKGPKNMRTDERTNGRTHTHDFLKLSTQKPLRGNKYDSLKATWKSFRNFKSVAMRPVHPAFLPAMI